MRKARNGVVWLMLAGLLTGCATAPYVDSRREAGQREPVGASTPDQVAICHAAYGSSPSELQQLADSECARTGRRAEFTQAFHWTCTLLAPTRAFFRCVAKP